MELTIFTIGHSNISKEEFLNLLRMYEIEIVLDVRSSPYSNYVPHFNRDVLEGFLEENDIRYKYLGDVLGGRYDNGFQNYRKTTEYNNALMSLIDETLDKRVVIMCSEINHLNCHRNYIAIDLTEKGVNVLHIQNDGSLKRQEKTLLGYY